MKLERRIYEQPLSGEALMALLRGTVMLQNLPSIVAAHALAPPPGARVLDMCASPGGKTTALAALMGNQGEIVALDVSAQKVSQIRALCEELGASIVDARRMDATNAMEATPAAAAPQAAPASDADARGEAKVAQRLRRKAAVAAAQLHAPAPSAPPEPLGAPLEPASFDCVMLDAPCSALGLRPRLLEPVTLKELHRHAALQRALLHSAVALLRPGGALCYSTCTINPLENEALVGWALATFSCLRLVPHAPRMGGPGLTAPAEGAGDAWLTPQQADLVQRFTPGEGEHGDTIGFFIARFEKASAAPA